MVLDDDPASGREPDPGDDRNENDDKDEKHGDDGGGLHSELTVSGSSIIRGSEARSSRARYQTHVAEIVVRKFDSGFCCRVCLETVARRSVGFREGTGLIKHTSMVPATT